MPKMQVFDPAMCCSTGVCGPSVDPTLPRFAADLEWLKSKGVEVERFNLAQQLGAFSATPKVKQALNSHGTKSLPMILVDGEVKSSGGYTKILLVTLPEATPVHEAAQLQQDLERAGIASMQWMM